MGKGSLYALDELHNRGTCLSPDTQLDDLSVSRS